MTKCYKSIDALKDLDFSKTLFLTRSHVNYDIPVGVEVIKYTGKALPLEDIQSIYDSIKNRDVVNIVAIGGGTIIDIAKIIALSLSNKIMDLSELLNVENNLENIINLIAVPTTCGSGSEATHFAVVYKNEKKYSIARKSILPGTVILDAKLLETLPKTIRNSSVLDALAQGIESLWSKNATHESSAFAKESIEYIVKGLEEKDFEKQLYLFQYGSYLAGKAINISKTTICHAISYYLTARHGVPHGVAVFLTIPSVAKMNYCYKTKDVFEFYFNIFDVSDIVSLKNKLESILAQLGYSRKLKDYGLTRDEIGLIAEQSLTSGRSDNNPVSVDMQMITNILERIFV
jgi:alcohol dehydrogenase class IV